MVRPYTSLTLIDFPQCGGTLQSKSNYLSTPNAYGFIKFHTTYSWTKSDSETGTTWVSKSDMERDGMWRIRFAEKYSDDDKSFVILKPVSSSTDEEGWFKCGRQPNTFEQVKIKFPGIVCELCTIQLQFRSTHGIIYQCADISLLSGDDSNWDGHWLNGGFCLNGKCRWPVGYSGKFWDGGDYFESNSPSVLLIIIVFVIIASFLAILAFIVIRFINKKEQSYQKQTTDNTVIDEIIGVTASENKLARSNEEQAYEQRNQFKHHKFEDDE